MNCDVVTHQISRCVMPIRVMFGIAAVAAFGCECCGIGFQRQSTARMVELDGRWA